MRQPEFITSAANPLLKEIRKAHSRGDLTENGWCVAETFHLLEAALASDCRVRVVIAGESVYGAVFNQIDAVAAQLNGADDIRMVVVPDNLLDAASQGVVALVEPPQPMAPTRDARALLLAIDGLQDPGNLGTILRSAEAFGATGVLLSKGSVNAFNPKVLRASSGSIFRVPLTQGLSGTQMSTILSDAAVDVYAAVPNGTKAPMEVDLTRPCALIIGSEGRGVSPAMRSIAMDLSISTVGVESLNAAVSAAVLLYEARRQRSFLPA